MINKTTAKKMRDHYAKQIELITEAQSALLTGGGVKSYKIGDMELSKFSPKQLDDMLEAAVEKEAYYDAILNGKATRKMVGIIPADL